jgi:hypothetical protein
MLQDGLHLLGGILLGHESFLNSLSERREKVKSGKSYMSADLKCEW